MSKSHGLASHLTNIIIDTLGLQLNDNTVLKISTNELCISGLILKDTMFIDFDDARISLNNLLSGRIYLGQTGYYGFGDLNTSKFSEYMGVTITLPFKKLKYKPYIDIHVMKLLLPHLDETNLQNILKSFPEISPDEVYLKLIMMKYPYLHDIIKDVKVNISWVNFYHVLSNNRFTPEVIKILNIYQIKRDYPKLYNLILNKLTSDEIADLVSVLKSLDNNLLNYLISGCENNYILRYPDIAMISGISPLLKFMINMKVKFESVEDMTLTLIHIRCHTTIITFKDFAGSLDKRIISDVYHCEPKYIPVLLNKYYNNMKSILSEHLKK